VSKRKLASFSNPAANHLDMNSLDEKNSVATTSNPEKKRNEKNLMIRGDTDDTKVSTVNIETRDETSNVDDVTHIPQAPRHPCGDIRKSDYNKALLHTKETSPLDSAVISIFVHGRREIELLRC